MTFLWTPVGELFGIHIEAYFTVLAFLLFFWWSYRGLKRLGVSPSFLLILFIGSYASGWLWRTVTDWISTGNFAFTIGVTSIGMLIGGILIISIRAWFAQERSLWLAKTADIIAPGVALFVFVYRMGCFFFGDVPGTVTSVPWAIETMGYGRFGELTVHPVALYLSLSALLIFIVLDILQRKKHRPGTIGLSFLILYSFSRFWIEFLAAGHNYEFVSRMLGLSVHQWWMAGMFLLGCGWYLVWRIISPVASEQKTHQ